MELKKRQIKEKKNARFQMKHMQGTRLKMNSRDACDRYAKFNHKQHPLNVIIYQVYEIEFKKCTNNFENIHSGS